MDITISWHKILSRSILCPKSPAKEKREARTAFGSPLGLEMALFTLLHVNPIGTGTCGSPLSLPSKSPAFIRSSLLRRTPLLFFQRSPPAPSTATRVTQMAAVSMQGGGGMSILEAVSSLVRASPPTWYSALLSNLLIFLVGSPLLLSGLSLTGICAAFLLGTLTWRAFGPSGFLLVATYFVIGTAVTKVKMAQKEAQGVAEKRKGRRGPGSVIGSSAAGCVCAFLSIYGGGGTSFLRLCQLGFLASFCTKLNDTVSSEIGKAYGKITYLVTTFKVVPRGTEGAVSVEGTIAGLLASISLASIGCLLGEVNTSEAATCVIASQIANFGESIIGAALQEKEGFQWLSNDVVNVINISMGSILAVLMQQLILQN